MIAASPILLAHQGGWDEILLIGGPILIIVLLLRLAKKRVDAATDAPTERAGQDDSADPADAH